MGNNGDAPVEPMKLTSFRSRRKAPAISGEPDDFINLLHGSDPIRIELTRLENQLRDKDRELGEAYGEIKSLKYSERIKEKAVEEDQMNKAVHRRLNQKNIYDPMIGFVVEAADSAVVLKFHYLWNMKFLGGVENLSRPSNGSLLRKTSFQSGSSQSNDASSLLKKAKNLSGAFDGGSRSEGKEKPVQLTDQKDNEHSGTSRESHSNGIVTAHENEDLNAAEKMKLENKDYVSGAVYDMLQKEVIVLHKACNEKDHSLKDKDDAIEMLAKKVETLNKAMAIEAKRMRREVAAMEKEVATIRNGKEYDQRLKCSYSAKGAMNGHTLPQRNDRSYKKFTEQ